MKRWARREVREHLRHHPVSRRARYSLVRRTILRWFFSNATFARFVLFYVGANAVLVTVEAIFARYSLALGGFSLLVADTGENLRQLSGYLIAAQAGVLGVITLALALVTLIAQRTNSDTDIRIYYHESMAFPVVASSVALLAVQAAQLIWPFQSMLHHFQLGVESLIFECLLLLLHLGWLLFNLGMIAYFIDTTFRFVHQSERVGMRERYTANIVFPEDYENRLSSHLYSIVANSASNFGNIGQSNRPCACFGMDPGGTCIVEVERNFASRKTLRDVRMIWVHWVYRRWSARCAKAGGTPASAQQGVLNQGPQLWFTPYFGDEMQGRVTWCLRRGGIPLTKFQRFVLRKAFIFKRLNGGE